MPREPTALALLAPPPAKRRGWLRSKAGWLGVAMLALIGVACLGTLPWTLSPAPGDRAPRYRAGDLDAARLPPFWAPHAPDERERLIALGVERALLANAAASDLPIDDAPTPTDEQIAAHTPRYWMGTDALGRDLLVRCLAGGGISLGVGVSAALISVVIGTAYGMISGFAGGRVDGAMMRIVDILYGLPYILLVVLLAVAVDALAESRLTASVERMEERRQTYIDDRVAALPGPEREDPETIEGIRMEAAALHGADEGLESAREITNIVTLLVAIGGVSWLTMARVVRGQTLSLKARPFVEAARAIGSPTRRILLRRILPNLAGPIIVYATLTAPQAILQESFLSFLGIGVAPPAPSWGNLAADGLSELNTVRARWWLLLFPCSLLGLTLLSLNFVGEGLREALDPRGGRSS